MKININPHTHMKHSAQVSSVYALLGVNKKGFSRLALWVLIFVFAVSPILSGTALAQDVSVPESPAIEVPSSISPAADSPVIDTPTVTTPATNTPSQGDPQAGQGNGNPPIDPGQGSKPVDPRSQAPGKPGTGDEVTALSSGQSQYDYTQDRDPVKSSLKVDVDAVTGAFIYSFPITIPPGRNGTQPSLSLNYHSQDLKNDNLIGYGWSLSIPYIERVPKTGVDRLYTSNDEYFTSSLSGELEKISAGNYGPKVENGDFLKYQFSGNTWTVTDKKGTVYTFGLDTASRQDSGTKIFKWMIQKMQDTNGNFVRYEYFKDTGQIYPSKIFYTGSGSSDGIFEIEFLRQTRTDKAAMYGTGFSVTTNHRINEIQAKVSGVWKRKYVLGYTTGNNSTRSLLNTITESGQDDQSIATTLPTTTFTYSTATKDWTHTPAFNLINVFIRDSGADAGLRMDDVNGDSLPDLVAGDNTNSEGSRGVSLNNGDGTGWTAVPNFLPPEYFVPGDTGTRMVDIDGDFFADMVRGHFDSGNGIEIKRVYLNNKNNTGWTQNFTYFLTDYFVRPGDSGARLADVNGDGLVDIPRGAGGNPEEKTVALNDGDGTGWTVNPAFLLPEIFVGTADLGTRLVDVNGDGLNDVVRSYGDGFNDVKKVWVNKGDGTWIEDPAYILPENIASPADQGMRLFDINGDGLVDIVRSFYDGGACVDRLCMKAYINKGDGTGWVFDPAYGLILPEFFVQFRDIGTRMTDVNGDGLVDFLRGDNVTPTVKKVYLHDGVVPDLLTNITSHTSATSAVTYQSSALYRNGSTLLNPNLPLSVQTVKQIVTNDGRGTQATTTYSYEGGYFYFNNSYDRKFAGFGKVTETDAGGNVTKTFYHQGNSTDSTNGEFSDHITKRGKPYRVEQYNDTSNLFSKTINKWDHFDLSGTRDFVKLVQTIDFTYDGDSDHKDKATTYIYDDTNGNLTQKKEWGEVTGSDNGTFTDTGTDIFTTDVTYASNPTAYIIGLPKQETTNDQSAVKVVETKHYYDLQAFGSVTKGNETKTEYWVTGTTYVDTEKTYDATYGLVTQEKDPRDKATNYTYDSFNLYPATVTQPHSLVTNYLYDYSSGKVTQTTDPNTRVFQTVYDGLDRVKEEKQPDKTTPTTIVTKATYSYNDTPNQGRRSTTKVSYLDASLTNDSVTYVDGLDRTIQTRTRAEDANTYSVKDVVYDALGHVQKESLPYSGTDSAFTAATTNNALYTAYTYDALDRVVTSVNAVGTTLHTYDQWKETVTDAKSKVKDYTSDANGNLIKIEEHNGAAIYSTAYTYNGLNKLLNITDALGNVRNFTYDGLARRLTAQDLHAPADGTFGTWTYTYDAAGNLTQQVDPKGQTVNFTYDDLNRVLTEDYTGQTGTEKSYVYDTCTEGKGHLCTASVGGSGAPSNLFTNGGFETGSFTPWEFQNWPDRATYTITSNPGEYAEGTKGLRVDITTPDQYWSIHVRQSFSCTAQQHTLKFWAKAASNRTIIIDAQDRNTWTNLGLWQTVNLTTSWQQFTFTFTPPAGYPTGWIHFYLGDSNPSVWIDGVELTTGSGGGSPTVSTAYTYYATGEVKTEQKTIDSNNYTTTYTYDRQGNTVNIKYPDNSEVQYAYNAGALTETVQQKESGGTFTNVVTDFDYSPLGQITYQANANGTETTNTYDANELYRLKRKYTTAPAPPSTPPTANFSASPLSGNAPLTVNFTDLSTAGSNPITSWAWDINNNGTTDYTSQNPQHIYPTPGTYSVKLTVSDGTLNDTETKVDYITVSTGGGSNLLTNGGFETGVLTPWVFQDWPDRATESITSVAGEYAEGAKGFKAIINTPGQNYHIQLRQQFAVTQGQQYTLTLQAKASTGRNLLVVVEDRTDYHNLGVWSTEALTTSFQTLTFPFTPDRTTANAWVELLFGESSPTVYIDDVKVVVNGGMGLSPSTVRLALQVPEGEGMVSMALGPLVLQDLTYTYDQVGNITQIVDVSDTDAAKTITYTYDDLHRLLSSTITNAANGDNVGRTYTYSAIGNILTASDQGTYLYEGTNYANPHAVTKVGTAVYGYDNNGNLTSDSVWTHSWDYNNKLTQSQKTGSTVTYQYDHAGQRTKYANGTKTIRYANKLYNTDGTTATKHIYAGSQLIATLEGSTLQYVHTDHLTGSNVASDSSGTMIQLLDYQPYGALRIDWKSGAYDEQRKFTGHMYDRDTSLTYAEARYYKQNIGRFLSQDPVFLAVGDERLLQAKARLKLRMYLGDPQSLNSYSYAVDNPLRVVDPGGEWIEYIIGERNAVSLGNWANNLHDNNAIAGYALDHPVQTGIAAGVLGGIALEGGSKAISAILPTAPVLSQQAQQLQENARKGAEFFQRTGYTQNIDRIKSTTQTASYRIPDVLDRVQKLIGEVKNVAYQGLTNQIKDYIAYAQQKGYTFELITRPDTILSKGLQEAVKAGEVIHKILE